jgi:hypothetical protein
MMSFRTDLKIGEEPAFPAGTGIQPGADLCAPEVSKWSSFRAWADGVEGAVEIEYPATARARAYFRTNGMIPPFAKGGRKGGAICSTINRKTKIIAAEQKVGSSCLASLARRNDENPGQGARARGSSE